MKILTVLCAAAFAICGTMMAQSSTDNITVRFATPVMVGGTNIPAGDCNIQVLRGSSDNVVLAVRSASGITASILVNRVSNTEVETEGHVSVVLSRHVDNTYRLDRILLPDHTGFEAIE